MPKQEVKSMATNTKPNLLTQQQTGRRLAKKRNCKRKKDGGITLTESVVTVGILAILGSISTPSLINQLHKSRQGEAKTYLSQVITQVSAYNDEFGLLASGWGDLDEISTIMTNAGRAKGESFSSIDLPSNNYKLSGTRTENKYTFTATPKAEATRNFNVIGCSNVATGASQVISGNSEESASIGDLKC